MMDDLEFKDFLSCWRWFIAVIIVMCIAGFLIGCTKVDYTGLESTCIDSLVYANNRQLSSIQEMITKIDHTSSTTKETIIKDSVVLIMNDVGDVISREVIKTTNSNINQQEFVSVIQSKVDSILDERFQQIYNIIENNKQIPIPIEKELTAWERIKQDYFCYLCGTVLILIAWTFRRLVLRLVRFIR